MGVDGELQMKASYCIKVYCLCFMVTSRTTLINITKVVRLEKMSILLFHVTFTHLISSTFCYKSFKLQCCFLYTLISLFVIIQLLHDLP